VDILTWGRNPWDQPILTHISVVRIVRTFGTFGPPAYMAGWVAMTAITKACADGKATRAEVTKFVRQTNIPSLIGDDIRFTAKGDVRGAKFAVFKVVNGKYSVAS